MRRKLFLKEDVANTDCIIVLDIELIKASKHHRKVGEDLHLFIKLIIDAFTVEGCVDETVIHTLKAFNQSRDTFRQQKLIVIRFSEDRQIIVPIINGTVEDEPCLLGELTLADSLYDMERELGLPLVIL